MELYPDDLKDGEARDISKVRILNEISESLERIADALEKQPLGNNANPPDIKCKCGTIYPFEQYKSFKEGKCPNCGIKLN